MTYSKSIEMYLETIHVLENMHGHARVVDIAERLDITKPSVTKAMDQLKEEGLVDKEAYGCINLTKDGKKIAEEIYYKHCLITSFLEDVLELSYDEASSNACKMEHIITDEMLKAVEDYMSKDNRREK